MSIADEIEEWLFGDNSEVGTSPDYQSVVWEVVQEPDGLFDNCCLLGARYTELGDEWLLMTDDGYWTESGYPSRAEMLFQGYRFREVM